MSRMGNNSLRLSFKYVCFVCRKRQTSHTTLAPGRTTCPCGKPLVYAGQFLRTPAREDDKGWAHVEAHLRSGGYFDKHTDDWGPGSMHVPTRAQAQARAIARFRERYAYDATRLSET